MDTGVIIALVLGVANIIGSICFGLVPSVNKRKIEALQTKVKTMAKDISFFYNEEDLLLTELSSLKSVSKETLKRNARKQIGDKLGFGLSDYIKPSVIRKEL